MREALDFSEKETAGDYSGACEQILVFVHSKWPELPLEIIGLTDWKRILRELPSTARRMRRVMVQDDNKDPSSNDSGKALEEV